jgi:hypothetical protein
MLIPFLLLFYVRAFTNFIIGFNGINYPYAEINLAFKRISTTTTIYLKNECGL